MGSSPQVRGKLSRAAVWLVVTGLIPAGAGQTMALSGNSPPCRAHPRRCGANTGEWIEEQQQAGSSPQVRGKRRRTSGLRCAGGLIPAGAGQTFFESAVLPRHQAHPRRCGANSAIPSSCFGGRGSSPQVRGKLGKAPRLRLRPGLIPAGAGQTASECASRVSRRAHPRRCGANVNWKR